MIYLAYLVAKRGDYSHFDLERRKSIGSLSNGVGRHKKDKFN